MNSFHQSKSLLKLLFLRLITLCSCSKRTQIFLQTGYFSKGSLKRVKNKDSILILVNVLGLGFDKRDIGENGVENSEDSAETIPTRQLVPKKGQEVFLSEERLAFGDLPLFTRGRRVVCLTNTSFSDTINFEWKPNDDPYSKVAAVFS